MQKATLEGLVSPVKAYSCYLHVMDSVEDGLQVTCLTGEDWQETQLADPILSQVLDGANQVYAELDLGPVLIQTG